MKIDPTTRVEMAHNNAVKAAQRYEAATPGTLKKSALYIRWQNAERKFEVALAALSAGHDAGGKS